jgi:predicted transglutaminase-like cysteine proteinase
VTHVIFSAPALAPMPYPIFCTQHPADCQHQAGDARHDNEPDKAQWSELEGVNRDVNHAIAPEPNASPSIAANWRISPPAGDCGDYAVTKRHDLLARGWPSETLLLAEVVIPDDAHHLVLLVRLRSGDVVLDNSDDAVLPVAMTHFAWVRAERPNDPKSWAAVRGPNA